ncbi:hypothetical protein BA896_012735 [Janthinobacterium lividum]|uniref:Phage-related minor tail protein n=1 Tax=Janthinobacterium lividum TaxID=29581 RepID=A0A1E8PVB9_9BURK|nr:hypothetical protein BA896_012735 [Janthinobacterium lividum]
MSVETAKVKAGLAENVRAVEGSAQKMAADLVAIRKGFENALDPLKNLTVKVGSLESNLAKAQSASFSLAKGLILGAAAGMSIDAIRGKVMGVIDSMAALKTTSEKTGSSVENLSKIGFFAKQAESDIDSVAAAIGKMSKGMAGADKETKGAGLALSFLGLKAKDLAGNLKDPAAMFMEIAKKLNEYEDGAGKAAIAQSLFGKAGADMLPTLKLMGEQGDIVAKATTEQATAARQYQRDLAKLDAQKGLLFKTIAVSLLPTLSDFTSAMIDATKNTNLTNDAVKGLAENDSISDWADSAALGVARLVDVIMVIPSMLKAVSGSFSVVGAGLEVMGAKAVTMNPFLVASEIAQGRSPQAELNKALEERQKKLEDANKRWGTLWNDPANKMEQSILGRIAGRKTGSENSLDAMSDLLLGKNGPKKKLNFNTAGEDGEDDRAASAAALKLSKADLDARLNLEKTANARNAAIRKESLADMAELNRQGIASDTQLYVAKYNAAIAAGTDIAAVKQAEIDILAKYNGKDAAEKRAANGKISVLEAERVEALRASSAEAVALRKQYIFDSDKPAREAQAAADAEISATYKQIEALKEQYTNYGLLPEAITAISIAKLEKRAIDLEENEGSEAEIIINQRKLASLRALGAQQKKNSGQVEGGDVAKAKELLDILTAVDAATKSAAQGMAASFGTVGAAIGGLTTALSGYAVQQQAITAQLAVSTKDAHGDPTKIAKAQAAAAQQGAQAQVKSYGDMASAAKGFFKENSTGYKVMETAEKAFRAYEMAMAVESMVKKIFFKETEVAANLALNGSKLTGEAATTAASTGLAATEASAWGITAVVKAMASLPFPLNLAAGAATLAAVVAIGAKMVGGMSGGSGGGKSAADVQKVQGTGSVFGDSSAKSDSIRRSIEQLKANSDNMLPINQGMLTALQSIEASMAGLTNLVVRTPGLTDGTNMGIQTGTIAKSNGMSIASGAQIGSMIGGYIAGPLGIAIGAIGGAIIGASKASGVRRRKTSSIPACNTVGVCAGWRAARASLSTPASTRRNLAGLDCRRAPATRCRRKA